MASASNFKSLCSIQMQDAALCVVWKIICITSAKCSKRFQNPIQKDSPRSHSNLDFFLCSDHPSTVLRTCCTLQSRFATRIFELLLFPPEGGGDHRGGVGVIGGRDSPWDERVGFEAPVSGGIAPLLLPHTRFAQSGRTPCLLPVVVPPFVGARLGHGMYSYACSGSGSRANGVCTVGCPGLARG